MHLVTAAKLAYKVSHVVTARRIMQRKPVQWARDKSLCSPPPHSARMWAGFLFFLSFSNSPSCLHAFSFFPPFFPCNFEGSGSLFKFSIICIIYEYESLRLLPCCCFCFIFWSHERYLVSHFQVVYFVYSDLVVFLV